MSTILNFKLWIILFSKLLKAVFPVYSVLIILALFKLKSFKNSSVFRFLLIAVFFAFALRAFIFFSGVPFSGRYFYGLAALIVILSVPGIFKGAELIFKAISIKWKHRVITYENILGVVIITLCLICAGKGINPDFSKHWMFEISSKIKELCPEGVRPVLVSTSYDLRIAYYAGAEPLMFNRRPYAIRWKLNKGKVEKFDDTVYGAITSIAVGKHAGDIIALDFPMGLKHLKDNIEKMGGDRVFFLIEEKDEDFKMKFKKKKLDFPLKLVKIFRKKKNPPLVLYQGLPVKDKSKCRNPDEYLTDYDHLSQ